MGSAKEYWIENLLKIYLKFGNGEFLYSEIGMSKADFSRLKCADWIISSGAIRKVGVWKLPNHALCFAKSIAKERNIELPKNTDRKLKRPNRIVRYNKGPKTCITLLNTTRDRLKKYKGEEENYDDLLNRLMTK